MKEREREGSGEMCSKIERERGQDRAGECAERLRERKRGQENAQRD